MRSSVSILALMLVAYAALVSAVCQQVRLRRPYSALSPQQRADYVKGIKAMKRSGAFDRMARKHRTGMKYHMTTQFLPMHRAMIKEFEDELIKANPAIQGLPYWDELVDSAAPMTSTIFSAKGLAAMQTGVLTAPFAGLTDDQGRLVRRHPRLEASGRFNWIPSSVSMAAALKSFKTFGEMSNVIEVVPHNSYHGMIGGHMGDTSMSPSDPVFWLHHCFIDLLWAVWQGLAPENVANLQTGRGDLVVQAGAGTVLYESQWKNSDMIQYEAQLCYRYQSALVPQLPHGNGDKAKKRGFFSRLWKGIKGVFGGGNPPNGRRQQDAVTTLANPSAVRFPTNATEFVHGVDPLPESVIRQLMPTMDLGMAIKKVRAAERKINEIAARLAKQVELDLSKAKDVQEVEKVADAVPTIQDLVAGNKGTSTKPGVGPKKAIKEQSQDQQPAVPVQVQGNGAERATVVGLAAIVVALMSVAIM